MSNHFIELRKVCKEYGGIQVLKGLSLEIEEGSIVGLTGPNGAGKTTLFDIVSGVQKASSGEIEVLGKTIRNLNIIQIAQLGVRRTFQNVRLFENMTVEDNLLVACDFTLGVKLVSVYFRRRKVYAERTRNLKHVYQILDSVNLLEKRSSLASQLSHGQRRLLELCRAMAGAAKLLLLDEPVTGVFPSTRKILINKIHKYRDEMQSTIIVTGHEIDILKRMCDYVVRLENGRIIC